MRRKKPDIEKLTDDELRVMIVMGVNYEFDLQPMLKERQRRKANAKPASDLERRQ